MQIEILRRAHNADRNPKRYPATFEPVRRVSTNTIGWATLSAPAHPLRFPAIVEGHDGGRILTAADWQAPVTVFARNLADPAQVATQIACSQGAFVSALGQVSVAAAAFAAPVKRAAKSRI